MPIESRDDLPKGVKNNVPEHAQDIWKEAYNNALEQYADRDDPEEVAARVAWDAVKEQYEKREDGDWYPKPDTQ